MRPFLTAIATSAILTSCTTPTPPKPEHPLSRRVSDEVHSLLLKDSDSRSLYAIMQEAELLLQENFPESSITVDVQLEKQKTSAGIWYVRLHCTIDKKPYTFFLSAQQIRQNGEKITPKEIVVKFVWDIREICRQYLQDRMSIFKSSNKKNTEQWLRDFLEEEKEVLKKHGLIFNGTIGISGGILSLWFRDTFHDKEFDYTFIIEDSWVIAWNEE